MLLKTHCIYCTKQNSQHSMQHTSALLMEEGCARRPIFSSWPHQTLPILNRMQPVLHCPSAVVHKHSHRSITDEDLRYRKRNMRYRVLNSLLTIIKWDYMVPTMETSYCICTHLCGPTEYSEQEEERSWLDIHVYSCLSPCLGLFLHIYKVCLQASLATVAETGYIQALGLNCDFDNISVAQGSHTVYRSVRSDQKHFLDSIPLTLHLLALLRTTI